MLKMRKFTGENPPTAFRAAWEHSGGRMATLLDIIGFACRIRKVDEWISTNSAEYYGRGADGRLKLIVAHGVGPLATPKGLAKAQANGWTISWRQFLALERGKFGDVTVLDAEIIYRKALVDDHHHTKTYKDVEMEKDPLWKARIGNRISDFISETRYLISQEWPISEDQGDYISKLQVPDMVLTRAKDNHGEYTGVVLKDPGSRPLAHILVFNQIYSIPEGESGILIEWNTSDAFCPDFAVIEDSEE